MSQHTLRCNQCGLESEAFLSDGDISVCVPCHQDRQYEKGYNAAIKRARVEIEHLYQSKNIITCYVIDELLLNMLITKPIRGKSWRAK